MHLKISIIFALFSALANSAFADVEIKDCRLFIEKAGVESRQHNVNVVQLYLKTRAGFDSSIQSVAFYANQHYVQGGVEYNNAIQVPAHLFPGAGDFWQVAIPVTANFDIGIGSTYESGVFAVTTVTGTKYWLRAADGSNFMFNPELFNNLISVVQKNGLKTGSADRGVYVAPSPDLAVFTANNFPYLNPNACN